MYDQALSILDISNYLSEWLAKQYPTPTAHSLAEQFAIHVVMSNSLPNRGDLNLRAEYFGNPPTITFYMKSIDTWHEQIVLEEPHLDIPPQKLTEICIFHEIIHHILLYPSTIFPQSYLIDIYPLKRTEQEAIAQILTRDWLSQRFPEYNTLVENIIK